MTSAGATRTQLSLRSPRARSAVGVVLIVGSVGGVVTALSMGSETQSVLVSTTSLAPGTELALAPLGTLQVPKDPVFDLYVGAGDIAGGWFLSSAVPAGEMIPRSALTETSLGENSVVSISLALGSPAWLVPGASASVWVQPPSGENGFSEPFVLSPAVLVLAVTRDEGFAADASTSQIDLLVSRRSLPGVLHAIANNFHLSLTPTDAPVP